ncbi:hypothetical protein ACFWNN_21205 [Lentzea sp. NPDC058450]|uniref:hypothetical protein n=1 Tax=Lentzea sp. NPDC058450 TaxID=3346505 RepID=UPI003652EAF8
MLATLFALALLTSCGEGKESFTFLKDDDDLGKKIEAEWRAVPGVAEARYEYTHSIDSSGIGLNAALKPETASEELVQELVEIAKKNYWQSTTTVALAAGIVKGEVIPPKPVTDKSIILFDGPIKIDKYDEAQVAELNQKYGPRPTKK